MDDETANLFLRNEMLDYDFIHDLEMELESYRLQPCSSHVHVNPDVSQNPVSFYGSRFLQEMNPQVIYQMMMVGDIEEEFPSDSESDTESCGSNDPEFEVQANKKTSSSTVKEPPCSKNTFTSQPS